MAASRAAHVAEPFPGKSPPRGNGRIHTDLEGLPLLFPPAEAEFSIRSNC